MSLHRSWWLVLSVLTLCIALATPVEAAEDATLSKEQADEFFEKQVRPLLVKRCYECHSADSKTPEGGLRVDSRAALLAGGDTGPAIVPGKPEKSLLIDAINYGEIYEMPPDTKMPAAEIAVLTRWIKLGAPWPGGGAQTAPVAKKEFDLKQRKASHWAWKPVENPPVPAVKDQVWPKDPLDFFILSKLEQNGLKPAPAASKEVLIRRAYMDLTGLPPTPAEIDAFVADESPAAFATVIDQLLKSPHFGERWARHWLDLVRYAESRGHEFDYSTPNAFEYRNYVIRALNEDVPYDQFLTEHVAGDLLENPRLHPEQKYNESVLGTGFWHLGEWVHSPVDIRKDETDRFDNMIDVFSKTFLGLTVACARCHDHKFDAISQQDYYSLAGYLQSSAYRQVRFDTLEHNRKISEKLQQLDDDWRERRLQDFAHRRKTAAANIASYLKQTRNVLLQTPAKGKPQEQVIAAAAKDAGLRPGTLQAWVDEVQGATSPAHPLHGWQQIARQKNVAPGQIKQLIATLQAQTQDAGKRLQTLANDSEAQVIADYRTARRTRWMQDGVSFGQGPLEHGEFEPGGDVENPAPGFVTAGRASRRPEFYGLKIANTDREAGKMGGFDRAGKTLRTPTFTVGKGHVWVLARGAGTSYAVVDSHRMINGPLHGSLIKKFNHPGDKPRWLAHPLGSYEGHSTHLEFFPEGDKPLEIYMVVQSTNTPGNVLPEHSALLTSELAAGKANSVEELATSYQQVFTSVLTSAADGKTADAALLLDWIARRPALIAPAGTSAVAEYFQQRNDLAGQVKTASRTAMAMWDGDAVDELLLIRGNSRTPGKPAPRRLLTGIAGEEQPAPQQGSGRLQLAQRMLDPSNPFTSRVAANRLWHHLTGRGIVASVDNFGVLGMKPTHPELLDHLAVRLRTEGWSLKQMIRSIMLSSTYQMSSKPDEAGTSKDPQNLLLHRFRIRRLQGEVIRDSILAISGRIDKSMGGRSVPVHLTPFMQGRGRPGQGPLDGNGRRSIYISVRRNFLSPMMKAFDTPQPFSSMGRRTVSNVPAQALILMNDPFVVQQAGVWAKRVLAKPASPEDRIEQIYREAIGRRPTTEELTAATAFLQTQAAAYGLPVEKAADDQRVWTDLCHVVFNVKEFIFLR